MKPLSEMTPEEREAVRAEMAARLAERPEAIESEDPGIFEPGAIIFVDGRYRGISRDVAAMWPVAEPLLQKLLDFLPLKHRLAHWRERIESGAVLLTIFFDTARPGKAAGVGTISYVAAEDGTPVVLAPVMTRGSLDLTDAAIIVECVAVAVGADATAIMAPKSVPVVPGNTAIDDGIWRFQGVRVRPMQ